MATYIFHLPPELLEAVFEWAIRYEDDNREYSRRRTTLCFVSKNWNDVVRCTPSLWCRVGSDYTPRENELHLARSQNHPLDLDFSFSRPPKRQLCNTIKSFLRAYDHLQRWRTAAFCFRDYLDLDLLELLSSPAPFLEKLEFKIYYTQSREPVVNLFNGQATRLKSVTLVNTRITWDNGLLSGLDSLELSDISCSGLTFEHLLSFLSSSPVLRILKLRAINIRRPESYPHTTINLLHLHTIQLINMYPQVMAHLMRHIQAPSCEQLAFRCILADVANAAAFVTLLAPFIPQARTGIGLTQLNLGPAFMSFSRTPGDLDIRLTAIEPAIILGPFLSILPAELRAEDTAIVISKEIDHDEVLPLLTTADRQLRITKLVVRTASIAVLRRLGERPWLFPALRHLVISMRDDVPGGLLSRMVQARCGIRPFISPEDLPSRLVMIGISGDNLHRYAGDRIVVEGILGEGVLEIPVQMGRVGRSFAAVNSW